MASLNLARLGFAAFLSAGALIAATALRADELALKRVLLSSGGLGYYEYEADVDGDATVDLTVPLDQVDDVLKSLVVFDDHGGVGGLDLPSREPLAETFRRLPFTEEDLNSSAGLIQALRGAEVEVGGARGLSGRIVSVAEEERVSPEGRPLAPRHRVTLMSDRGLGSFVLEDVDSVKFIDLAVQAEIDKALKALAANRDKDSRLVRLSSKGKEKRKLRVAYLVAAPLWKASYRLVPPADPDAKQALLQGWATLENLSGQDWNGVDLTLVSGQPVTFRQQLYRSYMVDRPEAPVEVVGRLLPGVDEGAIEQPQTDAVAPLRKHMHMAPRSTADAYAAPAPAAKPLAAAGLDRPEPSPTTVAVADQAVSAQEGLTQVSFHVPYPVSVGNGRTLSLPIIGGPAPIERLAIYQSDVDAHHPLSAVQLSNDGKSGLPPGIVTIYEQGAEGVSYVGDSRLSALSAGDSRLLSYALDQKVLVDSSEADAADLTRGTIAKGTLTIENLERRKTTYRVKATEPRHLIVVAPELEGWKLVEPSKGAIAKSEGSYRIPFDIKAGDAQSFVVTQEKRETRLVALASVDDGTLGFYVNARELDPTTRDQLAKLFDLRGKHAAAERALAETTKQIADIVQDQNRLKNLLPAVGAGSDLQKRYLNKLDQEETQLDAVNASRTLREKARDNAKRAVEDYIESL
jgi:hypothetical protein